MVTPRLRLFGVDDPAGRYMAAPSFINERALAAAERPDSITVLLKHQPTVVRASLDHFDLQLSGHTHGGQLFPFHALVRIFYRYLAGWYRVSDRSSLYVSRGAGTWGPPLRLFAPPEITLFVLAPAAGG